MQLDVITNRRPAAAKIRSSTYGIRKTSTTIKPKTNPHHATRHRQIAPVRPPITPSASYNTRKPLAASKPQTPAHPDRH